MANGTSLPNNRLALWIVGLLFPTLAGIGTSAIHTLFVDDHRITVLETQMQIAGQRLERIERKLDQLLEHRSH
jgi:hypothetical protein